MAEPRPDRPRILQHLQKSLTLTLHAVRQARELSSTVTKSSPDGTETIRAGLDDDRSGFVQMGA